MFENYAYRAIVINYNRPLATNTQTHCCHLTGVDMRSQSSQHTPLQNPNSQQARVNFG
jgi:hypothetical protein